MDMIYDLIIIGSGPAGLTAAIYAERAKLKTIILEKNSMSGGQVLNTYEVDNYPGLQGINGFDMGMNFREHAEALGAKFTLAEVKEVQFDGKIKKVLTDKETYEGYTVLVATGAGYRRLGVSGEKELMGLGVSYCATCDGAFFRNKDVAVVGGGDVAVEDAILLARSSRKVYLIHRRDELRAAKILQDKLMSLENVEVLWNSQVSKLEGEKKLEKIIVTNNKEEKEQNILVSGIFVAVGIIPNSQIFKDKVGSDEKGYLVAGEDGLTNIDGVFAAGDVRTKHLRQIITAAADGANAVYSVQEYLIRMM